MKARGSRAKRELGEYYVVDDDKVCQTNVRLEALARELELLKLPLLLRAATLLRRAARRLVAPALDNHVLPRAKPQEGLVRRLLLGQR